MTVSELWLVEVEGKTRDTGVMSWRNPNSSCGGLNVLAKSQLLQAVGLGKLWLRKLAVGGSNSCEVVELTASCYVHCS